MTSLGDFAKMRSKGDAAWDELTLKKNYKEALKSGSLQTFARFEDYKKAANYIKSNMPEIAVNPGDFDATVKNIVNEAYETGRPLEDIAETVKAKAEGDIDSGKRVGDNNDQKTHYEIVKSRDGSFKITSWDGYPNGDRPAGPFIILEGDKYTSARDKANEINAKLHKQNPMQKGKQIHEIHPVKFGGSPSDPENKVFLSPKEHAKYTVWWNRLLKQINNQGD